MTMPLRLSPSSKYCLALGGIAGGLFIASWGWTEGQPVEAVQDADGTQRATIKVESYSYTPNHLVVKASPVELKLVSVTTLTPHNFLLKDPAVALLVEQEVSAGATVTVRFTPQHLGLFAFYCDKRLLFFKSHREKGMEGRLDVR